jgi:3-carboxy-cis,cis-muconate cycloisomerase
MSFTLQQSQFLSPLLGDDEVAALFSVEADIAAMLEFEVALASAQAKHGFIPAEAAFQISALLSSFKPDHQKLAEGILRDGMSVPALVAQLKARANKHVHFGATSQDVIDTSLMIRAKKTFTFLASRIATLLTNLEKLTATFGTTKLMARTRMQQALPFTVADRIASWRSGIEDAQAEMKACHFPLQFGGPIGVLNEFGDKAEILKAEIAGALHLEAKAQNWHSNRAPIVALANACSLLTGALGKMAADCCLMAQNELAEIAFSGGGTSSAMSHKQNPIQAEALVTLARFNATLISGLHHSLVHEQERSGAAWTLEWMMLPQMILAAGAATRVSGNLLNSITAMGRA